MAVEHANLPDILLHEPKGVIGALAGYVYVANGAGSGTWKKLSLSSVVSTGSAGQLLEADGAGGFVTKQRLFRYTVNVGTLPPIAAASTAEVVINVPGLQVATDDVVQITKPGNQNGLFLSNARVATDGQLTLQFGNVSAAAITPTASEVYTLLVWRRG